MGLHTILGAGGAVGSQLVPVVQQRGERIRLVSRKGVAAPGTETVIADLTRSDDTIRAVAGSDVVYLLAGLAYDVRVWKESWPRIMGNVIEACKSAGCGLIFFDNVYMYGRVDGVMTEETPFRPCSRKGEIRAEIATRLLTHMKAGNIRAMIARAADFYGPAGFKTSIPNMLVFGNMRKGRRAQWMVNAKVPHSFTYVPDAAEALYRLAMTDSAWGQTWHMPTAPDPLTGEAFIRLAAEHMGAKPGYSIISKGMMQIIGVFNRPIKEMVEMTYQNAYPYVFSSAKYDAAFNVVPTSYAEGIRATALWAKQQ